MAQLVGLIPPPSDWGWHDLVPATPLGGLVFSNLTQFRAAPRPFTIGAVNAAGNAGKISIDALSAAAGDQEVLALFPLGGLGACTCCVRGDKASTSLVDGVTHALINATSVVIRTRHSAGSLETAGTINLTSLDRDRWPILVRLRVEGYSPTTILAKAWPLGEAEPGSWDVNFSSTRPREEGYPGLLRYGTGPALFSHHSVGTGGDSAPAMHGTLSGTVVAASTPVERTVVAVCREMPEYVITTQSDESGDFSMPALLGFTYTVYALDEAEGPYNAPIFDKVEPVA